MKDFRVKKYPEKAKPYEICVEKYLFGDRKLIWIDYMHIRFYNTEQSVKDALRDMGSLWLHNSDAIHPKNGIKISYRSKYVVCTRDEKGMYKNVTCLFKQQHCYTKQS